MGKLAVLSAFRPIRPLAALLAAASLFGLGLAGRAEQACGAEAQVSFAQDILPLLQWRCASCHHAGGEGYDKSGLDLTSYAGVMKGTKFGAMVVPGSPETSNLVRLVDWRVPEAMRMPHGKKQLSSCDREAIRMWIRQGAKDN